MKTQGPVQPYRRRMEPSQRNVTRQQFTGGGGYQPQYQQMFAPQMNQAPMPAQQSQWGGGWQGGVEDFNAPDPYQQPAQRWGGGRALERSGRWSGQRQPQMQARMRSRGMNQRRMSPADYRMAAAVPQRFTPQAMQERGYSPQASALRSWIDQNGAQIGQMAERYKPQIQAWLGGQPPAPPQQATPEPEAAPEAAPEPPPGHRMLQNYQQATQPPANEQVAKAQQMFQSAASKVANSRIAPYLRKQLCG